VPSGTIDDECSGTGLPVQPMYSILQRVRSDVLWTSAKRYLSTAEDRPITGNPCYARVKMMPINTD
jgi:hypothetical protein